LGKDKSQGLLKNIEGKEEKVDLTKEGQKRLKNMFRESLTFD
jgi:hypothetical protein